MRTVCASRREQTDCNDREHSVRGYCVFVLYVWACCIDVIADANSEAAVLIQLLHRARRTHANRCQPWALDAFLRLFFSCNLCPPLPVLTFLPAPGANVVLTTKGIDDMTLKYFVEAGVLAVRRVPKDDLK